MLPVAHMVDTDPVVLVDGKEKRIRTEPTYLLQPASGYGHAAVHLSRISLAGMELKEVYDRDESVVSPSNGPRFGVTYFSCTMTSAQPLQGGFAAVMIYSPGMFAGAPGHFNGEVIVH